MSMPERRALISKKIYPKYKQEARTRIRLTPLRDQLYRTIKRLPKKQGCDVLAIPPSTYSDIPYYEIESFTDNIVPDCIYIKINARTFGSTSIFNTRDFNYYSSGLSEITNRINEWARASGKKNSPVLEYNGFIMTRPGKKNDGIPESYYLEMILAGPGRQPVTKQPKIPHIKKTKAQERREANVKKYVISRMKSSRQAKSVFKKIKSAISKEIQSVERTMTLTFIPKKQRLKIKEQSYHNQVKKIGKYLKDGKISEKKYRTFLKDIDKAYGKAKGNNRKT